MKFIKQIVLKSHLIKSFLVIRAIQQFNYQIGKNFIVDLLQDFTLGIGLNFLNFDEIILFILFPLGSWSSQKMVSNIT
jgi:hypothetical protein